MKIIPSSLRLLRTTAKKGITTKSFYSSVIRPAFRTTTVAVAATATVAFTTTTTSAMSTSSASASSSSTIVPRLYLGTMTFGWSGQTSSDVTEDIAYDMVTKFVEFDKTIMKQSNFHCIDTARIYAGGKTEQIVGNILKKLPSDQKSSIRLGTKAAPSAVPEGLSAVGIQSQFKTSMDSLGIQPTTTGGTNDDEPLLYEYYLHQPDTKHDLLESLKAADELVKGGKVTKIGMSNYHVTEVKRAFELCTEHNLTPPTVYQGLYNPLNRMVEDELLPLLTQHNCAFVAYNPLAAGLLTGKHTTKVAGTADAATADTEQLPLKGRFYKNPNYLPRFYTPANFQALELIERQCEKDGITLIEATFQWLLRESQLDGTKGDGLLLGASSIQQLDQNLAACQRVVAASSSETRMSSALRQAFDDAWSIVRDQKNDDDSSNSGPFCYWRSYSADMPNRETLHQGASYNAAKVK